MLRCSVLGARRFASTEGEEGRRHIVAASRLQLVFRAVINYHVPSFDHAHINIVASSLQIHRHMEILHKFVL